MTTELAPRILSTFYDGWRNHQQLLLDAIRPLTDEQVQLRPAMYQSTVWQLAAEISSILSSDGLQALDEF